MVVFIHRQEKFGLVTFEDGSSTKGIAEIILAKNRNGPVDDVRLRFREEKAQFVDLEEFDLDMVGEMNGTQSITLGSKMNHDRFRGHADNNFDNGYDYSDEPPFA
jgi:replicative DNA helicase